MNAEKPKEETSVYKVLSNAHRRRIIEMIGPEGKTSFTEMRKELGTSVGALYHHLDSLGDLITQDGQHKYSLTKQGKQAYKLMNEATDQFSYESSFKGKSYETPTRSFSPIVEIFLPRRLLLSVSGRPLLYLPFAAIVPVLGAWVAIQTNLTFLLIFPDNHTALSPMLRAVSFVVSWLILFGASDLVSTFAFSRKGGDSSLLVGTSLALLPMIVFSGLWFLFKTSLFNANGLVVPILLILFQIWTITILSCAISFSKGLRIERSALVSFLIAYLSIVFFVTEQYLI